MGTYFKNERIGILAEEIKVLAKANNKTDAVIRALENEIIRLKERESLSERVEKVIANRQLPLPTRAYDHKQISDELWDE